MFRSNLAVLSDAVSYLRPRQRAACVLAALSAALAHRLVTRGLQLYQLLRLLLLITLPLAPPALAQPSQLDPTTTQVTAGGSHTCALTTVGGVKCWGFNGNGQLGDSSTTNRQAPVDVSGLASGVAAIAAGDNHTCALTTTGGMKCWGYNAFGQLGDGSITAWSTPVDVSGLTGGVTAITAGAIHTCALTTAGGVKCWGANFSGQLGDGSTTNRSTPVNVSGLAGGMTAIAAGYSHACAMTTASGVKCWGFNGYGQLGDGSTTDRLTPVDVSGVASGVTAIAAGDNHTCTLTTMGGVKCSGNNGNGQLGDGSTLSRLTPVDVSGLTSGVSAIAVGGLHTCALTTWGGVKCWGYNSFGQLGDGSTRDRLTPVDISGLTGGVTAITAGAIHTCALTTAGGVKCWGFNVNGQLGDGNSTNRLTPVTVGGLTSGLTSGVTAIAAGGFHTCALTPAGGVKCWGNNGEGQLGDGTRTNRSIPVDVSGLASGVTAIAAGTYHTCALTPAGGVKCWGYNVYGQLGDGSNTDPLTPVDVLRGQSISFTPPILLGVGGAPVTLTATSGSGLPVSFDTWTPTTCTVSGNTVTAPAPALCGIRASQAGDGNNSAAPQKLVLVNVIATTLNVDASAVATRYHALSDGLIVMRFMRGLTGAALTAGTSVPGAAVNDPVVIASNLASMGMLLDIDGNGTIDAATDGQLIVRYMLGLRGEALIANALGTAPRARSTAVEIEAWLAALMP